jgi:hypothetical protein
MPELISTLLIGLWGASTALLTVWAVCLLTAPRLTRCDLCGEDTDNGPLCRPCAVVAEGVAA